jgi:hypothetical protein
MYAHVTALGILAALAFALPLQPAPAFTLDSSGAVSVRGTGQEARFGVVPQAIRGRSILTLTLGNGASAAVLHLARLGDRPPAPGRYPISGSWEAGSDSAAFHAAFMPGTAEQPRGWFHGESGWVTIADAGAGRMSGSFEIRARGFEAADVADEDRWVTVRGSFDAAGDSTAARIASAR